MQSNEILKVILIYGIFRLVGGVLIFTVVSCYSSKDDALVKYNDGSLKVFEKETISTNSNHEGISFISENYDEIIFTRSSKNFKTSQLLYSRYNEEWSMPKKINLSGSDYEAGIAFSPDMKKAFFTNKKPIENNAFEDEWNIWEVDVISVQDYNENSAKPLDSPINSNRMDCCLTMNSNGTTLFSSNRDGTWDIYQTKYESGGFKDVKKLDDSINSSIYDEWPSFINEEENIIFFSSIRKEGFGGDDLYYSKKSDKGWSYSKLFNQNFNSASYEDGAFITKDKKYVFFSSWKPSSFSKEVSNVYIKNIEKESFLN